ELAQQPDELLACGEPARHESGLPLRRVPAAEVLDHGLWMDGRLRVRRELAHRRRAAEPLGAFTQLREDLIVRVALADSGLKRGKRVGVDLRDRPVGRLPGHDKKDRAFWKERKFGLERRFYEATAESRGRLSASPVSVSSGRIRSSAVTQRGQNCVPADER